MWYENTHVLSYNKIFNFCIGNRGCGKTFSAKKWAISSSIRSGTTDDKKAYKSQFVWIRRYKSELKDVSIMFDDVKPFFPKNEIIIKGNKCYIDGILSGYFISLSTSVTKKSVSYHYVDKIIYDEFLIEKGSNLRYLSFECESFLSLCETVIRMKNNVRIMMIANNTSLINPYFTYFKLKPDLNKRFNVYDNIIIEYYVNNDFIDEKLKTKFGNLINNTKFGDYSICNKVLNLNDSKIIDLSSNSNAWITINYKDKNYGVWYDNNSLIFSEKYDKNNIRKINLELDNNNNDGYTIKRLNSHRYTQLIKKYYEKGDFYFNSLNDKAVFMDIINKLW